MIGPRDPKPYFIFNRGDFYYKMYWEFFKIKMFSPPMVCCVTSASSGLGDDSSVIENESDSIRIREKKVVIIANTFNTL